MSGAGVAQPGAQAGEITTFLLLQPGELAPARVDRAPYVT